MESRAVSQHEIIVCIFAFDAPGNGWFTSREVEAKMKVKGRTVRHHLLKLVKLGIIERRKMFGGCRYRLKDAASMDDRALDYVKRLSKLRETFDRKPGRIRTTLASFMAIFAI